MLVTQSPAQEIVGNQSGNFFVGTLVQVLLRNVRSVAAHGIIGVFRGKLEGVVPAGAAPAVGDFASEASDQSRATRLEIRHGIEVSLAWGADTGSLRGKEIKGDIKR